MLLVINQEIVDCDGFKSLNVGAKELFLILNNKTKNFKFSQNFSEKRKL